MLRTISRVLDPRALAMLACAVFACIHATAPGATGATSDLNVAATVISSTTVNVDACDSATDLSLGALTVGSTSMTSACMIEFGSSNNTAKLLAYQRDGRGAAMTTFNPTWILRRGSPTLWDADFGDSSRGWIVGRGALNSDPPVLRTTADGGATWTPQTPCAGATNLSASHAFSSTDAVVVGNVLCRTTNAGSTWNTIATPTAPCGFIDGAPGSNALWMACSNSRVMRSTDRGATWTSVDLPVSHPVAGVTAFDDQVAYVATQTHDGTNRTGYVWRTTDGGASWAMATLVVQPGIHNSWTSIDVSTAGTIIVTGWGGMGTWRSVNGGVSFTQVGPQNYHGTASVGSTWIGSTSEGSTSRSVNDGVTWAVVPTTATTYDRVEGVSADVDGALFITVGMGDSVTRSTDGGASFTDISVPRPSFDASVHFGDGAMVVFGANGYAMRSADEGATVTPLAIPTVQSIRDAVRMPSGTGIAVGTAGTILRSTDEGANWTPVSSPTSQTIRSIDVATKTGVVFVIDAAGALFRSLDDGVTWAAHAGPGVPATMVAVSPDGQGIWTATAGTVVRRSLDGGATWATMPTGGTGGIMAIDVTPTGVALVVHQRTTFFDSQIRRSADDGASWTVVHGTSAALYDLVAVNERDVWAVGESGFVARSTNGGASFSEATAIAGARSTASTLYTVSPIDASTVLVGGNGEAMLTINPILAIPDFHAATANFSSAGGSFGACLADAGAATNAWTEASTCLTSNAAHWRPLLADHTDPNSVVATTASSGLATAELRFGLRVGANQNAGDYRADIAFDVIAPG